MSLPRSLRTCGAVLVILGVAVIAAPAAEKQALLRKVGEYHLLHARQGAAAVTQGDFIYISGGSAAGAVADIERFNLRTGTSERVCENLRARRFHSSILHEGKIYLFGGENNQSVTQRFEGAVEIFDLTTNAVTLGVRMPTPRSHMGTVQIGTKVYFAGGVKMRNESESAHAGDLDIYDLTTREWSTGPAMPTGREASAVLVGGFMVVPGGFRGRSQTAQVEMFVPKENTWKTLPPLARKISAHSAVRLDPYLFLFGDYADLDLVLAYDLRTRTTTEVVASGFRGARHTAAVVHEGLIYVIGGGIDAGGGELDLIQVFAYAKNSP